MFFEDFKEMVLIEDINDFMMDDPHSFWWFFQVSADNVLGSIPFGQADEELLPELAICA